MALITKEVEVVLGPNNIKHFENKGYEIPRYTNKQGKLKVKRGTVIIVKVEDLPKGSNVKVNVKCNCCGKELKNIIYNNFIIKTIKYGGYYCLKCAVILYGSKISVKTKLLNTKSFELWCMDNNKQDVLDRWDYELNKLKPNEIPYGTLKKYYFKCPRGLHKSELKSINSFTNGDDGRNGVMDCKRCNSFAQFGIDNLGEDFLEKYWDYEKNTVDPWEISKCSDIIKIHIYCQEKNYHGSYPTKCSSFTNGSRCGYCTNNRGIVHPLDSLGKLYPQVLEIWSDKNDKSPYEYTTMSTKQVWWKCPEGKHKDYPRKINVSNMCDFRCPECNYSKGEERIDELLTKYNILHDSQYKFDNLKGIGGRLLKFDIPVFWDIEKTKLRMLIEYDGEFHFRWVKGLVIKKEYERMLQHDIKKNLYCAENNIQLIRIPYWEFNNIEKYLKYYLIDNNEFDY